MSVFLKKSELVKGGSYIFKDGKVCIYLGLDVDSRFIFYHVGCVCILNELSCRILHRDIQLEAISGMISVLFTRPADSVAVLDYRTLPYILQREESLGVVNISVWWTKSALYNSNLPILTDNPVNSYVNSKDLVRGELYYSGNCSDSVFVFIGRKTNGEFVWQSVRNRDCQSLVSSGFNLRRICITKNNKKVKPLHMALSDTHAYVSYGVNDLIRTGFKLDLSYMTQKDIDNIM